MYWTKYLKAYTTFITYIIPHYDTNIAPYIKHFDDTFGSDNLNLYRPYQRPIFCWPYLPSDPGVNYAKLDDVPDILAPKKLEIPEKRYCYPFEQEDYKMIKNKN